MSRDEKLKEDLITKRKALVNAIKAVEKQSTLIAKKQCPLKVGDEIFYKKNGKEYKGKVNSISFASRFIEYEYSPKYNAKVIWVVNLARYNKTTGMLSNYRPVIAENTHKLKGDLWVEKPLKYDRAFADIMPMESIF